MSPLTDAELDDRSSVEEGESRAWYDGVWSSVKIAGNPPTKIQPPPEKRIVGPRGPVTDEAIIAAQLGRPPRGIHAIGHRCPCGNPDVVTTEPRLPNGTPFPTTYYLTCPRVNSRIGTLEASGLMREMQDRLGTDPELAAAYQRPTSAISPTGPPSAAAAWTCRRSRASRPAACRTG